MNDLMIQTTKCQSSQAAASGQDAASSQGSTNRFCGEMVHYVSVDKGLCKRQIDQEYRARKKKIEMEATLKTLGEKCIELEVENAILKNKVEHLEFAKKEREENNKSLEQQNEKLKQQNEKLESDLHQSKRKCIKLDGMVKRLNTKIISCEREHEYEKQKLGIQLENEKMRFKKDLEIQKVMLENEKLRLENTLKQQSASS